ncbi:MAG: guanylate kinase [Planctomycetota bacterium]|nr:MAG: guanylate kinase [Planctomycetota bacterium]
MSSEAAGEPAARGRIVVISGPSGAGKSSVIRRLLERDPRYWLSVSLTTRARRPGELDGRDYHFVDRATFERLREQGKLLEWAEVHGELYGTPREPLERAVAEGRIALLDIDVQGAEQIRHSGIEADYVFIAPPSLEELERRLRARGTENAASLARRLAHAREEMAAQDRYDVVIINDDLDRAAERLDRWLRTEESA